MRIIPNTFAVFWSRPGCLFQFHADVPAPSAAAAAARFRELYPEDVVRSVRGRDGRFTAFA